MQLPSLLAEISQFARMGRHWKRADDFERKGIDDEKANAAVN